MRVIKNKKRGAIIFTYFLLSVVAEYVKSRRGVRRWGIRPLNLNKKRHGHFYTLFSFMKKNDPEQFFKYTRMEAAKFNELLEMLRPYLQKDCKKRHISPEERLAITLHYLSEGCSMQQLAWDYYIGKSTAHQIINQTCRAIWEVMSPVYLKPPSKTEWGTIADGYYKKWNLPNCIGSVDGKHIAIQCPQNSHSTFFNYKKHFSIVLMATCDSFYRFTMVDIGAVGSNHDGYVFRDSGFGSALINGKLNIPEASVLPNSDFNMDYFLAADAAFPLHKHLMRPYPGSYLGEEKNIFNYRLSRGRRVIENTFGIMCQRWRLLRKTIIANVENCEAFTLAIVVLHNFLQKKEENIPMKERKYCPTGFVDYVDEDGVYHYGSWRNETQLKSVTRLGSNNHTQIAKNSRDQLAAWFVSDAGSVPWQYEHIYKGSVPT